MLDILLKNCFVIDGTQKAGFMADIAIKSGKIIQIAPDIRMQAKQCLDIEGKVAAPGFIDIHTHSDLCPFIPGLKPVSKLYQGVTLEICGNCGMSNLPVNDASRARLNRYITACMDIPLHGLTLEDDSITDYIEHIKRQPAATNIGVLIGHGTLRGCVIGMEMRAAMEYEQKQMEFLLERELERGAFGLSLGLIYPPSSYGNLDEFIGLGKILKKHEALLAVHMRSESKNIFQAVDEMLTVAKATNVHIQLSHLKLMGKRQWGKAGELLGKIEAAKEAGVSITCDQYPYTATSTGLSALVPKWALDGGYDALCQRLQNPSSELLEGVQEELNERGGAGSVLVTFTHGQEEKFEGLTLEQIAQSMELSPAKAALRLLQLTGGAVACCYFSLDEQDMEEIMQKQYIAVASDGYASSFDKSFMDYNPHPRSYGTFPRFFQLVREKKLLSLPTAVYKASTLPAKILGLADRGLLKEGYKADITVFDAEIIKDNATYICSVAKPSGIKAVIIDGKLALLNGEQIGVNLGRVLRHENI